MSSIDYDKLKKFWEEIGLVVVIDSGGSVVIGRIIDVDSTALVMRDLQGLRHWINQEAVVKIMELGERNG